MVVTCFCEIDILTERPEMRSAAFDLRAFRRAQGIFGYI